MDGQRHREGQPQKARQKGWLNATVMGIVLATFFSDVSHEMCTAVLPLYLLHLGLGPASLGIIEGVADFLVSLSKLGGGVLGHYVARKRPWVASGYLVTAFATSAMSFVHSAAGLLFLRSVAWIGRGYRGPMRDYLLSDAVEKQYYGRAYGLERAGDMLGAVTGPLAASLLVLFGVSFQWIVLFTALPGLVAAIVFYSSVRERPAHGSKRSARTSPRTAFPMQFRLFLVGVTLFGLGDFSRTFLVLLATQALDSSAQPSNAVLSLSVAIYLVHNAVSAVAAYPAGHWADRTRKIHVLIGGYALGVVTNLILFTASTHWIGVLCAVVLSGIYIAIEETVEKAAAAELLPRNLRNLGFGILACANAVGDMLSSVWVGWWLSLDRAPWAFGAAAACGAAGCLWIFVLALSTTIQPDETPNVTDITSENT